MLALQIKKRSVTRTVYVPHYSYWTKRDAKEIALDEQRTREGYALRNFRFHEDRTVYTCGRLTVVFNLEGYAIEGYSYDACMFAFAEPTPDFPQGRVIWNDTSYSVTTNSKHRYTLLRFAQGPATSRREVTEKHWNGMTGEMQGYTHNETVYAQWQARCEVANMPWHCPPSTLRDEIATWRYANRAAERSRETHAYIREQRALRRRDARIAARKHLRVVGGAA